MADTIADVGPDGTLAAMLIYRWPVGPILYPSDFGQADLRLLVQPLAGAHYTPQGIASDSPITLQVADLNGDGQRDLVVLPRWGGRYRFARSGLAAWPCILSAAELRFQGGHLASRFDNRLYFSTLRPMLYYAGPKQATFADVDSDGWWEVDVAYSLEDGAAVWQVDRYHWDGRVYTYTETFTRPAAEPFPPDRYLAFLQALGPLPEGAAAHAQQIVEFDADSDGQPEMLLTYLLHPFPSHPEAGRHPGGNLMLALFGADNRLWWRSQPEQITDWGAVGDLITAAVPVHLETDTAGLFFYRLWVIEGSGVYRQGLVTLYRWDGHALAPIWQQTTAGGGQMGAGSGSHMGEVVWLEDIDADGRVEVLTRHIESRQDDGWEYRAVNYLIHLPGVLAFRWDGAAYVPGYFIDEGQLTAIRPRLLVYFAPRLSYPLTIDGNWGDWAQIEYWRYSLTMRPDSEQFYPEAIATWDDQRLYLTTEVATGQTIILTLDSDLAGDFANTTLDTDDLVLETTLPTDLGCRGPVTIRSRHALRETVGIQATIGSLPNGGCALELAIPLETLGLAEKKLVTAPGWVSGSRKPRDFREYYPRAGRAIGFAVAVDGRASTPDFRPDDPTTWNTLIFMADR